MSSQQRHIIIMQSRCFAICGVFQLKFIVDFLGSQILYMRFNK